MIISIKKTLATLLLFMIGIVGICRASIPVHPTEQSPSVSKRTVECGTLRLRQLQALVPQERLVIHKRFREVKELEPPRLGMKKKFFAADFRHIPEREYVLDAQLVGIGEGILIWVEDSQWNNTVTTETVKNIKVAFEEIVTLETKTFGVQVPDVDSDGRVSILLMDIRDEFHSTGGYIAGYFFFLDELPEMVLYTGNETYHSNGQELLYIDTNPTSVSEPESVKEVIAHEFSHLLLFYQDPFEEEFIDEGIACYAGFLATEQFPLSHIRAFEQQPDVPLTKFNGELSGYGASFLYTFYLSERFGSDFIGSLMRNPRRGIAGVNATLKESGYSQTFATIYSDHKLANYTSSKQFSNGTFGYEGLQLNPAAVSFREYPIEGSETVFAYGTDYLEFERATEDFQLTFTSNSEVLDVKLIAYEKSQPVAVASMDMEKGTFTGSEFKQSFNRVVAAISAQPRSTSRNQTYSYLYKMEMLKGDVNKDGQIRANDAVLILQIAAGLIEPNDYQKSVADMNNDGRIKADDALLLLRQIAGFAAPYMQPIATIGRAITVMLDEVHGVTGESIIVPLKVDNIDGLAGGDICIVYDGALLQAVDISSNSNVLLASNITETGIVRVTFAGADRLNSNTIAEIRFDILADGVSPLTLQKVELYQPDATLVDSKNINGQFSSVRIPPKRSELLPNFPNPFNPETWIPFKLANDAPVTISIYNAKGQIIRTLFLGAKKAGAYVTKDKAAYWDGRDSFGERVASGVYYYTLQARDFTATRKMMVIK